MTRRRLRRESCSYMRVNMWKIGEVIRRHRRRCGLRQVELAELLERDQGTVSRWERDELTPSVADVWRMSLVFRRKPSQLLREMEVLNEQHDTREGA